MLDHIHIEGFKSIRQMDLDLKHLNVLIGANGSGKTNFIGIFKLLNQIIESNLQTYVGQSGGANTFLYFGQKITTQIIIELNFGRNGYDITLAPSQDDTLIFESEICSFHNPSYQNPYQVSLGSGYRETMLHEEARQRPGKVASFVINNLKSWKIYHFHDTSDSAGIKKLNNLEDNRIFRSDASNLAAFLYLLRETQYNHYTRIRDTIRLVAPFFDDFVLQPSELNPNKIRLEWQEVGSDSYFNAFSLSDGTLRFMCLATLLLQPRLPSTILIDEPELGLHPYAITLLSDLIQSAATQTQVIVSTQSVPFVNQFKPEDIIVVDRIDRQSVFKRPNQEEIDSWLDEYGMGDLWAKNIIGGRPRK
jgi:predicted ATPase